MRNLSYFKFIDTYAGCTPNIAHTDTLSGIAYQHHPQLRKLITMGTRIIYKLAENQHLERIITKVYL